MDVAPAGAGGGSEIWRAAQPIFREHKPPNTVVPTEIDTRVTIERVGMDALPVIRIINKAVFRETRVINQFDRPDLLMLLALAGGEAVGFKIGYGESRSTFYSAKGAVVEPWRRHGVARALLYAMMEETRAMGYRRLAYDTFPNMHPGMIVLGLQEGFRVTAAGFNSSYKDYRIRLEKPL